MKMIKQLVDNTNPSSLATMFRRRRFGLFVELAEDAYKRLGRPLRILDVGGTEIFWDMMGYSSPHLITLLNLTAQPTKGENFVSVVGDARDMPQFSDYEFDIVFSNSVIEHVGMFEDQSRMANEIRRLAPRYFVQTPSYFFPIEPHFLFPFFHWLPRQTRIWLVTRFSLGWYRKTAGVHEAATIVDGIRLLKRSEMQRLFPDAQIVAEKFLGLTKSYIALKR